MRPPRCHQSCTRGTSLLEVLVALAIAAVLLAWLLPGLATAVHRQRDANQLSRAVAMASDRIEALSSWPADLAQAGLSRQGELTCSVEQTAVELTAQARAAGVALRTFAVRVRADGQSAPVLELHIQRLGRAP